MYTIIYIRILVVYIISHSNMFTFISICLPKVYITSQILQTNCYIVVLVEVLSSLEMFGLELMVYAAGLFFGLNVFVVVCVVSGWVGSVVVVFLNFCARRQLDCWWMSAG